MGNVGIYWFKYHSGYFSLTKINKVYYYLAYKYLIYLFAPFILIYLLAFSLPTFI